MATDRRFGLVLLLFLNIRYLIEGAPAGIAFFISLYDFFDNLGLASGDTPLAMTTCADNACSLWGSTFELHQTWGVAFFDRFVDAPALRTNALYLHLACNSIVFVLMHIQLLRPGHTSSGVNHAWLGRLSMTFLTIGTVAALYLASEHDAVSPYGGIWAGGASIRCRCASTELRLWAGVPLFKRIGSNTVSG